MRDRVGKKCVPIHNGYCVIAQPEHIDTVGRIATSLAPNNCGAWLYPPMRRPALCVELEDLRLEEEFHLYAGDFDQIMVAQLQRLATHRGAVDGGKICALDVGDEKPARPSRDHRDLHAWFANGGEILGQIERASGRCA